MFSVHCEKCGSTSIALIGAIAEWDINGSVLVISQFTLCGDWKKGKRPSFVHAAPPEKGKHLYEQFIYHLIEMGIPVDSGEFGAAMSVSLVNEGPVTFVLDSKN